MTDEAFKKSLKAIGCTHFIIGVTKDGKERRASENMTIEHARKWEPGILKQYYEKFKIVEDTEL